MDDADNEKASEQQQQEEQEQEQDERILHLPDAQVGETETDELTTQPETKHVSFDPSLADEQLIEAHSLVNEIIERLLPQNDTTEQPDADIITEQPTSTSQLGYNDERLQRILRLLDRYTRNLEAIEEHVRSRESNDRSEINTELQVTQHCELSTQTQSPNSVRLDVTSTITRPKSSLRSNNQQQQQQRQQQQQQQQLDAMPPCESRYHTITISTHSSSAYAAPPRPTTILGKLWRTLGDFAGACCLCLQVNKDCVFCLGFFIAFVISASFLTAFFYRTIKLTHPVRAPPLPIQHVEQRYSTQAESSTQTSMVTLRLNGGYYYVFNNHQQHIV